jgi:RNA polymerase sigma factor (sigma-70 family)
MQNSTKLFARQHSDDQILESALRFARLSLPVSPSTPCTTEESLYQAIQEDRSGWQRQIFDEYLPLVRGLLLKTLGPRDNVEDLVSDVFVGLFESARNIRAASGMRSYVVSVTLNTLRRELKRQRRKRLLFFTDSSDEAMDRVPSRDDPKAKAALRQLSRFLEELDADERLVFVRHSLEGMALPEVATTLKMSRSTVKRRLKRAHERILRRVLRNPLLTDYVRDRSEVFHVE